MMTLVAQSAVGYETLTPETEPFIDLVQVRSRTCFGTGLLVARGLVLTALHCARDPTSGAPREGLGVYLLRDLSRGEERHLDARILWPRPSARGGEAPDVALLRITGRALPEPRAQQRFGELPSEPVVGSARGFPRATAGPGLPGGRIEHDQAGRINFTSVTRRTLTIDATGPHAMDGVNRWSGLSGGPLLARGLIIGVMREVPEGWLGEAIEAEPLAPLLRETGRHSLSRLLPAALPLGETTPKLEPSTADRASAPPRRTSSSLSDRLRQQLLNRLENYWIHGALEESLLDRAPMHLPLRWAPEALRDPFEAIHQRPEDIRRVAPDSIIDAFEDASRNLLILGEPGAGKSTLLLQLLRDLIVRARLNSGEPIPVVLNLSTWANRRPPLNVWIMDELTSSRYGVPEKTARAWVDGLRVLPLLDGLDEIPSTAARESCILAINAFRRTHGLAGIAAVGRSEDYHRLNGRLELDGCVLVEPPAPGEVRRYLRSFDHCADGWYSEVADDPDVTAFLNTPLTVNLTVRTSLSPGGEQDAASFDLSSLVPRYVQAMFRRRAKREAYSMRQTLFTLVWLARNLDQTGLRSFSITDLQPDWLRRRTERHIYRIANQLICRGLAAALAFTSLSILAGLQAGVLFAVAAFVTVPTTERILPVGRLMWDGTEARASWRRHALNALFWAIALSYFIGRGDPTRDDVIVGTAIAVFSALADIGLSGLVSADIARSRTPREVIHQMAQSAVLGSIASLFVNFAASALMVLAVFSLLEIEVDLIGTLFLWAVFGAVIGLAQYGGYALVQHYLLRVLLVSERSAPFRLERFLDYATSRVLLRRIGGHYAFLHRVAMDYFVGGGDRSVERPRPIPAWAVGGAAMGSIALLLALGLQWGAAQHHRTEAQRFTEYGFNLLKSGDLASARRRFDAALGHVPSHVPALFGRALVAKGEGDYGEAIDTLQEATALWPQNAFVLLQLGLAELAQGHPDSARDAFGRALELYPGYPSAALGLAIAERRAGRQEAAGPHAADALVWRGFQSAGSLPLRMPETDAARELVRGALEHLSANHLMTWQDVHVTFDTGAKGVGLPADLARDYPNEMTIRMNEWFSRLRVRSDHFAVTLNFDDAARRVVVPYASITQVSDLGTGSWFGPPLFRGVTADPFPVSELFDALIVSELFWSLLAQGRDEAAQAVFAEVSRPKSVAADRLAADGWLTEPALTADEVGWALTFLGAYDEAERLFDSAPGERATPTRVALGRAVLSAVAKNCAEAARSFSAAALGGENLQFWQTMLRETTGCALTD